MNTNIANSNQEPEPRLPSRQMRAVLTILATDPELDRITSRFVDIKNDSIQWKPIFDSAMSSGQRCALSWARALWCEQLPVNADYIMLDAVHNLEPRLKGAIVKAIATTWQVIP